MMIHFTVLTATFVSAKDYEGYQTFSSMDVVSLHGGADYSSDIICYASSPGVTGCVSKEDSALKFPVDITLQICDTVQDCRAVQGNANCLKRLGNETPGNTTYLSVTKCGGKGVNATIITSASGHKYKYCDRVGDAILHTTKLFALPPDLCEATCSNDVNCAAFQTDGQLCFILGPTDVGHYDKQAYFRLA